MAGLLNGDVLLGVDGVEVSGMETGAINRVNKFFSQPVGTQLELHVERGKSTVKVQVELRGLLDK